MAVVALLAEAVSARFRGLEGSHQIASTFALAGLWHWLDRRRPSLILEIGGGIGCASEMLRHWAENRWCQVVTVEDDLWCIDQWRRNVLPTPEVRLAVTAPPWLWDFVVLDGPQVPPGLWEMGLAPRAVIFVEGNRRGQRREIVDVLLSAGRGWCWANWRPPERTKGFWIIVTNPTALEQLWFAGVRLREWMRDLPARAAGRAVGKKARG